MKRKTYYTALRKSDNIMIIATFKKALANHIGLSTKTIARHLRNKSSYDCKQYALWRDVPVQTIKRGFRLKPKARYY